MIQDTFFSLPRFIHVCRKEMVEGWRVNVMRIVLCYGILALFLTFYGYLEYSNPYNLSKGYDPVCQFGLVLFAWAIFIMGAMSASVLMERMKSKTGRTATLMFPATSFEKYFARWVMFTIVFLVVFLIAFKLADYTRIAILSISYPDVDIMTPVPLRGLVQDVGPINGLFDGPVAKVLVALYCFVQSCFILGSTIWPKNAFLKTFVAYVLIMVIFGLTAAAIVKWGFTNNYYPAFMAKEQMYLWGAIFLFFFACVNWVLGYFRFKESEIINRM